MSRENVEVVRRLMDTMTHDVGKGVSDFWEPDGDYYPVRKFPESRPCHGPEEIRSFMAEFESAWENYEVIVKEAHSIGDDRVLLHGHIRAEGRDSGISLEGDIYQCFWLRHGRLFRQEDHLTKRGALRALGLSDDPGETIDAVGISE